MTRRELTVHATTYVTTCPELTNVNVNSGQTNGGVTVTATTTTIIKPTTNTGVIATLPTWTARGLTTALVSTRSEGVLSTASGSVPVATTMNIGYSNAAFTSSSSIGVIIIAIFLTALI
jgi:hypothetical protein